MWRKTQLTAIAVASAGRAGRSRERERDEGGEASRRSQATMGVIKGKTDRPTPCPRHRLRGDTKRTPTPSTM